MFSAIKSKITNIYNSIPNTVLPNCIVAICFPGFLVLFTAICIAVSPVVVPAYTIIGIMKLYEKYN